MMSFSALYVIYHVTHSLGFLVNVGHVLIISRITFRKQDGGKHYRTFLLAVAIPDILIAGLRLSFQSYAAQDILWEYKIICATSATLHNILVLGQFVVLFLGSIDRLTALTHQQYFTLFHVRHFTAIIVSVFISITCGFSISAWLVYEKAFSLGGIGVCKPSSSQLPTYEPGLFPLLITLLLSVALSFIIIHKIRKLQCSSVRPKAHAKRLTLLIVLFLCVKLICWLPVPVALVARIMDRQFGEDIIKLGLCLNVILDPLVYGMVTKRYRQVLQKLFFRNSGQGTPTICEIRPS